MRAIALLSLLFACTPEDEASECGENTPAVVGLSASYMEHDFGQGDEPALQVVAESEDEDGDLTQPTVVIWTDTTIDGSVDSSGPGESIRNDVSDETCGVESAQIGGLLPWNRALESGDQVEIYVEVIDDAGNVSEGAFLAWTNP